MTGFQVLSPPVGGITDNALCESCVIALGRLTPRRAREAILINNLSRWQRFSGIEEHGVQRVIRAHTITQFLLHFLLGLTWRLCLYVRMSLINLTPAQLRHAADLKEKIESLQQELNHLQGTSDEAPSAEPSAKPAVKTRNFSAAGLARIRAAQKLRWAKVKGTSTAEAKAAKRGRRKMSAEGRAKIAAAARARWAKVRAAKSK
jgi:hypothetical protein